MAEMTFAQAIEKALDAAMAADERVVVFGEDVELLRRNQFVRFGTSRVMNTPISESGFLGAAVGAAMGGLRPVVEIMLVDFLGVCFDALLNHAAKVKGFSGGKWDVPLVVRCSCGGGYGDGGQHEQCLWGLLAGVPGLSVVVPSNPADAAGLMLSAIRSEGPVVYLEHKLLSDYWLDYLGAGARDCVEFDVPEAGAHGEVSEPLEPVALGKARVVMEGSDLTIITLGVSVHRSLEAAVVLARKGIKPTVMDLRTVSPLDKMAIVEASNETKRVLVVDEDYLGFGLSGEISAVVAEAGIRARFARVATAGTIPYARDLEAAALPNVDRIVAAATSLINA
ncbi:MAG: alpha-ketoacid dehydrogenase subunit beta [Candidatus Geothermincolia bacterium]